MSMKGRKRITFQASTVAEHCARDGRRELEGGNGEARLAIGMLIQRFPLIFKAHTGRRVHLCFENPFVAFFLALGMWLTSEDLQFPATVHSVVWTDGLELGQNHRLSIPLFYRQGAQSLKGHSGFPKFTKPVNGKIQVPCLLVQFSLYCTTLPVVDFLMANKLLIILSVLGRWGWI